MLRVFALCFLFCALCACQVPATYKVEIRARYPEKNIPGKSLFLRGSGLGLNWTKGVEMSKNGTDVWVVNLFFDTNDLGSVVQLKTMVDDEVWQVGGNENLALSAVNGTFAFFPWFFNAEGEYRILRSFTSAALGNTRDAIVYVPPSYFENTLKTYENVLIMHDGQNIFNASTSFLGVAWECQKTVNALVGEGKMEEIIIVGLYNTVDRNTDYTYSFDKKLGFGGKGNLYLDLIEEQVIPWIAQALRVPSPLARSNLGILGSSLGGLISCYAGWTRPQIYSKTGCMSSSFWWNGDDFNNTIVGKYTSPLKAFPDTTFYVDSGNMQLDPPCRPPKDCDDRLETIAVRDHFERMGFVLNENVFYYLQNGGVHNEGSWGARFHVPMTDLYPPTVHQISQ